MKTIQIALFSIICFILGFCIYNHAQNPNTQIKNFIEQSINGQSYIYDTSSGFMQNKKNYIDTIVEPYHCDFGVEKTTPFDEIFDKIFSIERKKELKGKTLMLGFNCDSLGNVLEMRIYYKNISMLTIKEVNAIENAFLKYKFKMSNTCIERKYYRIMSSYKWN